MGDGEIGGHRGWNLSASDVSLVCLGVSLRITRMDGKGKVQARLVEVEALDGQGHRQDQGEV